MKVYAGTSGFSYPAWRGSFYPPKLPAAAMLAHYAQRLPGVEINHTFYRMPSAEQLERWRAQVPAPFRFSLKASRRITHIKRLADCREETEYLFRAASALGEKLGSVLFQLPPSVRVDRARLEAFLEILPRAVQVAVEFRHASWFDQPILDLLCARGLALVVTDSDEAPVHSLTRTADWAYLRLRRSGYAAAALEAWAQRLKAAGLREAHVFFKHEDAGAGPRLAEQFLERVGGDCA